MHKITRRPLSLQYYLYRFSRGIHTYTTGVAVVSIDLENDKAPRIQSLSQPLQDFLRDFLELHDKNIGRARGPSGYPVGPQYAIEGVA